MFFGEPSWIRTRDLLIKSPHTRCPQGHDHPLSQRISTALAILRAPHAPPLARYKPQPVAFTQGA